MDTVATRASKRVRKTKQLKILSNSDYIYENENIRVRGRMTTGMAFEGR